MPDMDMHPAGPRVHTILTRRPEVGFGMAFRKARYALVQNHTQVMYYKDFSYYYISIFKNIPSIGV